jgi:cell shape-determining protein MreD
VTRVRVAAALAAILTALLLQATVVAPTTYPWPVSLPALLVAAVGLREGAGSGMSIGFATGLVADLASRHPAGVLALAWLGVGLVAGLLADRGRVRRDAVVAGALCTAAGTATSLALAVLSGVASVSGATAVARAAVPTLLVSCALALALVPLVRAMLASDALRARRPISVALLAGASHD